MEKKLEVLIVAGSKNDLGELEAAFLILNKFKVPFEVRVSSAHRTLKRTVKLIESAEKKGLKVVIAAAGMSAHLPGVIAALTTVPVIGVPLSSSSLNGLDSLMSIVQMPSGIPVATMAIGKSGATNAAILSVSILALNNPVLSARLKKYRGELEKSVISADEGINLK